MPVATLDQRRLALAPVPTDSPFAADFAFVLSAWQAARGRGSGVPALQQLDLAGLVPLMPALAIIGQSADAVQFRLAGGGLERFHGLPLHGRTIKLTALGAEGEPLMTTAMTAWRQNLPVASVSTYEQPGASLSVHRLVLPLAGAAAEPRQAMLVEFYATQGHGAPGPEGWRPLLDPQTSRFRLISDPGFA